MAVFIVCLVLFLAMTGHSDAAYCICNSGLSDPVLQKSIDYACGNGADCSPILQNGPCFNPNTVKDHCNYAVNSYYQRQGQAPLSCSFSNTATVSQTAPSAASGCVYPSSPSNAGGSTTPTNTSTAPPGTGGAGGSVSPTNPGTGTPGITPGFGPGPSGSGITTPDGSGAMTIHQGWNLLVLSAITIFFSGLIW